MKKKSKIYWVEPSVFIFFGVMHMSRIWGLFDREGYREFWISAYYERGFTYCAVSGIMSALCIAGITVFFANLGQNYWWRWIYIFCGGYVIFDLAAILLKWQPWEDLLIFMYNVDSSYWNVIWGFFIILGGMSLIFGIYIAVRKKEKSIYRNRDARQTVLDLYDKQLSRINAPYKDLYVKTSFGLTHLIETGNLDGIPLLVFHGGNATTAYNLLACGFLMKDFHIFAVDTVGHPGKSEETVLSAQNYDYGKWTGEMIEALGFEKMRCFGGSFGAGIIAKAMCVAPDKIERAVLYVPSGIKNAPSIKNTGMLLPMIMYWITHKEKWFIRCIMPLVVTEENLDDDLLETARCSIDNVKIHTGMPSNVSGKLMRECNAHTLVMAAENDCMFPAKLVIPRADKIIPNCITYLLKARGHANKLTDDEKMMIVNFLTKKGEF